MPITKKHMEFHPLDLTGGFESVPGYPPGVTQKILTGKLDEKTKTGGHTRLLRFEAGAFTTEPFVHDYWEEVYQVTGDLWVGSDAQGKGGERFEPNTYACRPPGAYHGPFRSEGGCILLEHHYYDESK